MAFNIIIGAITGLINAIINIVLLPITIIQNIF